MVSVLRCSCTEEAMEEEARDLGGECASVATRADERPSGEPVQHAQKEVGGGEELLLRAAVAIQLTQDCEPATEVFLPLGGDLRAVGLRQRVVVPVDDLEGVRIPRREVEVGLDQRMEAGLRGS